MYDGSLDYIYRFRDSFLRTLEIGTDNTFVTDLSNRLETRRNQLSISFETNLEDQLEGDVVDFFELVPEPFDIADTIIVPAGRYQWTPFGVGFETSEARPFAPGRRGELLQLLRRQRDRGFHRARLPPQRIFRDRAGL